MSNKKNLLITGGAGFIGSHLVIHLVKKYSNYRIINVDSLTYASNLKNLAEIQNSQNYIFEKIDIRDKNAISQILIKYEIDNIIHLAAESHVDNSINNPLEFAETNVMGTLNLLDSVRNYWNNNFINKCFYHVSTDEVYGSLGMEGSFLESTPYNPRSPYSASKASSDHFVKAYHHTYKMPIIISNCSNNYGPHQFTEKLIPLMINNIVKNQSLPIYGDGKNIRDWLYVKDHVEAIDLIFHNGKKGETYNIGGNNELNNIDIISKLILEVDKALSRPEGWSRKLISYVTDRKGHDFRYSIDSSKLKNELGWIPKTTFDKGLQLTIEWYLKSFKKN
jgi:dTDP-glucose 4,6-dehydratase|tara:strand:- start:947 stop:1951 length:1005 start_codon:yes stop_codon:yes gene_type:complete